MSYFLLIVGTLILVMELGYFLCREMDDKSNCMFLFFAIVLFVIGIIIFPKTEPMEQKCNDANISYELLLTTAAYTNATEQEIYDCFVLASEREIEPYEAIHSLAPNLTEKEINAIITLSDLKQK